jgi:hypothetical protein
MKHTKEDHIWTPSRNRRKRTLAQDLWLGATERTSRIPKEMGLLPRTAIAQTRRQGS